MFRPADAADCPFAYRLYMHEAVNPYVSFDPLSEAHFAPEFAKMLEADCLVWEEEGTLSGIVQIRRGTLRYRHSAMICGFAVDPGRHRRGVGTRMMASVLAVLRSEGITRFELAVSADNPGGITFYEKLGFVWEGTMKAYFTRAGSDGYFDEHLMALVETPG